MGCDIHCYVEYRTKQPRDDRQKRWRDFGGRINPGRNYMLFELMAGVRGDESNAVVAPRGMAEDAATKADGDNWMYIVYEGEPWDGATTPARAAEYAKYGSRVRGEFKPYKRFTTSGGIVTHEELVGAEFDGNPTHVANPDWHTHSWLTADEFADALRRYDDQNVSDPYFDREPEYRALLAAMRALEAEGNDARLVFWFDN